LKKKWGFDNIIFFFFLLVDFIIIGIYLNEMGKKVFFARITFSYVFAKMTFVLFPPKLTLEDPIPIGPQHKYRDSPSSHCIGT